MILLELLSSTFYLMRARKNPNDLNRVFFRDGEIELKKVQAKPYLDYVVLLTRGIEDEVSTKLRRAQEQG